MFVATHIEHLRHRVSGKHSVRQPSFVLNHPGEVRCIVMLSAFLVLECRLFVCECVRVGKRGYGSKSGEGRLGVLLRSAHIAVCNSSV